ncbi:hypothetical protein [Streptomyces sp. MK7]|nr:hypothetical protein [Streptomyces sp. MK7]
MDKAEFTEMHARRPHTTHLLTVPPPATTYTWTNRRPCTGR